MAKACGDPSKKVVSKPSSNAKNKRGRVTKSKSYGKICGQCAGSGFVKKKRKLPPNNHFPKFFTYVAQRAREQGKQETGIALMLKAADCWRKLTKEQKDHFVKTIMPTVVPGQNPRPPKPPSSQSPSSSSSCSTSSTSPPAKPRSPSPAPRSSPNSPCNQPSSSNNTNDLDSIFILGRSFP